MVAEERLDHLQLQDVFLFSRSVGGTQREGGVGGMVATR